VARASRSPNSEVQGCSTGHKHRPLSQVWLVHRSPLPVSPCCRCPSSSRFVATKRIDNSAGGHVVAVSVVGLVRAPHPHPATHWPAAAPNSSTGSPPSPSRFLRATPSVDGGGVTVCVFGCPPLRHSAVLDIRLWLRATPAATTPALHIKVSAFGDDRGMRLPPVGEEGVRGGRGGAAAGASATVLL